MVNPSVKLVVLTVLSLGLLLVFDPLTPTVLYLGLLGLWLVDRTVPVRTLLLGHLPFLAFALSVLVVNSVTRAGRPLARLGPLTVTNHGLAVGGSLAMRTLVVGLGVILMVRTTPPAALLESLRQNLRLPDNVCFAVVAGYRLLADLPEAWQTLLRAHRMRGFRRVGPAVAGRAAVALLASSIRRGERLAIVMQTRGLGAHPRTSWRPQRVTASDLAWAVAVLGTAAALTVAARLTGL